MFGGTSTTANGSTHTATSSRREHCLQAGRFRQNTSIEQDATQCGLVSQLELIIRNVRIESKRAKLCNLSTKTKSHQPSEMSFVRREKNNQFSLSANDNRRTTTTTIFTVTYQCICHVYLPVVSPSPLNHLINNFSLDRVNRLMMIM